MISVPDEIKRAYRKLARKYQPDVSKEADGEARFKKVGDAKEVLKASRSAPPMASMRASRSRSRKPSKAPTARWSSGRQSRQHACTYVDPELPLCRRKGRVRAVLRNN